MQTEETIDISQHPMSLGEQKQVYEASTIIVAEALTASYKRRSGMIKERAVVNALLNAGWKPPIESISHLETERASVAAMSRNPSVTYYTLHYRGYQLPYVGVFKYPVDDGGNQIYPINELPDGTVVVEPHQGAFKYELSLDKRWIYEFDSLEEIEKLIPLLADSMAVSAGFACHGSNNKLNPHGPTLLGHHRDTPTGEVQVG